MRKKRSLGRWFSNVQKESRFGKKSLKEEKVGEFLELLFLFSLYRALITKKIGPHSFSVTVPSLDRRRYEENL